MIDGAPGQEEPERMRLERRDHFIWGKEHICRKLIHDVISLGLSIKEDKRGLAPSNEIAKFNVGAFPGWHHEDANVRTIEMP